ncbi:MAG: hypothetical protein JXR94_17735, partial [Candidatus Hydrogenedentes bacterium]|nr:hypothetical protein [Candidatus Hydrogenedentota bacterium]
FEVPCRTYVSVYSPAPNSRANLLLQVAMRAGQLACCDLGDKWVVRPMARKPRFDVSLTEAKVRAKCASERPAAATPATGIARGCVILNGHLIAAPYALTVAEADDSAYEVAVNGLALKRFRRAQAGAPAALPTAPELPESGQFPHVVRLSDYLTLALYPKLLAEKGQDVAWAEVLDFVASQDIVERIIDPSHELVVVDRQSGVSFGLFPGNYDFRRAEVCMPGLGSSGSTESAEEGAAKHADGLARRLADGAVLVSSEGVGIELAGRRVKELLDAVRTARNLPVLQAECVLAEVVEDRRICRELAANLPVEAGALEAALTGLVAQGGQPAPR